MNLLTPHQKKIYQEQDVILSALKRIRPFPYILSGGTALSRFYSHHRFSEDLDFFCEEMTFSFEKIEGIVQKLRKTGMICEVIGKSDQPGRLMAVSYVICPPSYRHPIKIDFLEDPFSGMWKPESRSTESGLSFRIDAIDQIYYRKFFSLLEQWHRTHGINRIKDLIDIYALHQYHRSIEQTVGLFRKNHVPLDEEKMIMILGSISKKEISEHLAVLTTSFEANVIWKTLKQSSENMLKKGLSR